ncbi:hypothetical protein PVK64_19815 [Aliivibrio sp. S4TY2]|uniref:hypothetical protein n=1 Tax=unclassified Aliivibrio TaxID=2645654 RepID=UPI00237808A8|nr:MULTISPECIES: hypothetical protein [unclassified Aliivibrio]MDD9158416.1 hypothetical protein [Aliivibrio sp. S4TY2]MDD9162416.1 hypothetical protein [Aliivibrio sp. S4TY1]MDD9166425.1 hypothetical protein [Aliivibrio sp. S4MY2]MDD9170423.1 hypothetical protein [Aliivibrio sp. S4MY4]MDD9187504.1 hypothetical protein [Aliivibrio sp. S4MY3]
MSHPIYYNSIVNEAYYIEQLVSASANHVTKLFELYSTEKVDEYCVSEFEIEHESYIGWLIETVSSHLILCATRTRVLQDSYDFSIDDNPHYSPDREAFEYFDHIVEVIQGNFKPSLRECCNKIIHATSYDLVFEKNESGSNYWLGKCELKGNINKKEWIISLDARKFCFALRYYIDLIKHL